MKLHIKHIGVDMLAPESALTHASMSLYELETYFTTWFQQGLRQMDWSKLFISEDTDITIKLADIDIELEDIDLQVVLNDPFTAFKHYMFPRLEAAIRQRMPDQVDTQQRVIEPAKKSALDARYTKLNASMLALIQLFKFTDEHNALSTVSYDKSTLRIELKRQISQLLRTKQQNLSRLMLAPMWPILRRKLVHLYAQDKQVLIDLLGSVLTSYKHESLKIVCNVLNTTQLEQLIVDVETILLQSARSTQSQQHVLGVLFSLYQAFVKRNAFSTDLLRRSIVALKRKTLLQPIAMWCEINKSQADSKAVAHLHAIVNDQNEDIGTARLFSAKHLATYEDVTRTAPLTGISRQIATLTYLLQLLHRLQCSNCLPRQNGKTWYALRALNDETLLLPSTIANQLGHALNYNVLEQGEQSALVQALDKLQNYTAHLRTNKYTSNFERFARGTVIKMYVLLMQLPDVPAQLLQAPSRWSPPQRLNEVECKAWIAEVDHWCIGYYRAVVKYPSLSMVPIFDPQPVLATLRQIRAWLEVARENESQVIPLNNTQSRANKSTVATNTLSLQMLSNYTHIIQLLQTNLPVSVFSKNGVVDDTTGNVNTINTLLEQLISSLESIGKNTSNKTIKSVSASSGDYKVEEQTQRALLTLYEQLIAGLDNSIDHASKINELTLHPSVYDTLFHQRLVTIRQALLHSMQIQRTHRGSIKRLYQQIMAQRMWLLTEVELILSLTANFAVNRAAVVQLFIKNLKHLDSLKAEVERHSPWLLRWLNKQAEWSVPLVDYAITQLIASNSVLIMAKQVELGRTQGVTENKNTQPQHHELALATNDTDSATQSILTNQATIQTYLQNKFDAEAPIDIRALLDSEQLDELELGLQKLLAQGLWYIEQPVTNKAMLETDKVSIDKASVASGAGKAFQDPAHDEQQILLHQVIVKTKACLTQYQQRFSVQKAPSACQAIIAQAKQYVAQLRQIQAQQVEDVSQDVGLVILWPFLPTLFFKLGLLHPGEGPIANQFIDQRARMTAHAILCRIAKIDPLIEVSHTVNILLGLTITEEIEQPVELDDKTISLIEQMLHAVINRWSLLKNMPIEEFTRLFIARQGVVTANQQGWQIQVEKQPQDVLMAQLPWGLGIIQLPWLGQLLINVEWKYGF